MTHTSSILGVSKHIDLTKHFLSVYLLSVLLAYLLHELAHYIVAQLQGIPIIVYFNRVSVSSQLTTATMLSVVIAGPLLSLVLAYSGIALLKWKNFQDIGLSFALANSSLRLFPLLFSLIGFIHSDETTIAYLLHSNPRLIHLLFMFFFLPPFILAIYHLGRTPRQKFTGLVSSLGIMFGFMATIVMIGELNERNTSFPLFRLLFGLPVGMWLLYIIGLSSFCRLLISRYRSTDVDTEKLMEE